MGKNCGSRMHQVRTSKIRNHGHIVYILFSQDCLVYFLRRSEHFEMY